MGSFLGLATVIGPILLIAALIYAYMRNKNAPKGNERQAEAGARDLREDIADDPDRG